MAEFTPDNAEMVALAFLGTGMLLGLLGLGFIWMAASGRRALAVKVFAAGALVGGIYAGALLTFSLLSEEKTLAGGAFKYFCELDCHTAYTVTGVETAKTLGEGGAMATAEGTFYVVTVRTWFDAETVSSGRPHALPLRPNWRVVRVVDEAGQQYATSLAGQKALVAHNVPLTHELRPGESYDSVLVFDLPADARNPRLLLADWDPVTMLLIGHENSFLHKKIYFQLESGTVANQR
jgi:hypothetical protein